MAKITTPRVELTQRERIALARSVERVTVEWARQQRKLAQDQWNVNLRYVEMGLKEFKRSGVDLAKAYKTIAEGQQRQHLRRFARAKKSQTRKRWMTPRRPNTVVLPGSGVETVPFDMAGTDHGEQGNVSSAPYATVGAQQWVSGRMTRGSFSVLTPAVMTVKHTTGQGLQTSAWSYAATGFWVIPGTSGGNLTVNAALGAYEIGYVFSAGLGGAYAASSLWLGLQAYDPSTGQFSGSYINLARADIVSAPSWSWFQQTINGAQTSNLQTSVSVNPNFSYVVVLWLSGYVATQGPAGADLLVSTSLDTFNYTFP